MKVAEFFNHQDFCQICKKYLTREAEIDVMVDTLKPDDFVLAGAMFYNFNGTRFNKNSKMSHTKNHLEMMKTISEKFPKTFTLNTRFIPRIDKSKLSDMIEPWFVNTFDARFFRMCNSKNHLYYYTSKYIIEGEMADQVEIDYELINSNDFRIYNMFVDGKHDRTEVASVVKPASADEQFSHITLPPIPLNRWDITSYETIKDQLEKYVILK